MKACDGERGPRGAPGSFGTPSCARVVKSGERVDSQEGLQEIQRLGNLVPRSQDQEAGRLLRHQSLLQASSSYHKEEHQDGDSRRSGRTHVSVLVSLPGLPYWIRSPRLWAGGRQGLRTHLSLHGVLTSLPWNLSCFGQVTEPLSPILPNCKDHSGVPAWAPCSQLTALMDSSARLPLCRMESL